jgi:hypothetical protein
MALTEIMPLVVSGAVVAFLVSVTASRSPLKRHVWVLPAVLSIAFLAWTVWAVVAEGPFEFWPVHTRSLWGNQIWFDLLFAVSIGWVLIIDRARALGMRVWPWLAVVATTGCIGFLAMLARFLYLREKLAQSGRS